VSASPLAWWRRPLKTEHGSTRCAIGCACPDLTHPITVRDNWNFIETRAYLFRANDVRRPGRRHPVRVPGCGTRDPAPGLRAHGLLARCRMRVQASDAHLFHSNRPRRTLVILSLHRSPAEMPERIAALKKRKGGQHGRPSLAVRARGSGKPASGARFVFAAVSSALGRHGAGSRRILSFGLGMGPSRCPRR